MKAIPFLLLLIILGCTDKKAVDKKLESSKKAENKSVSETALKVAVIDAEFPLSLNKIDFETTENSIQVNDGITAEITKTVTDCYNAECNGDCEGCFSVKDSYVKTIRLTESKYTLFVNVIRGFIGSELICKVLFYDNELKSFIGQPIDLKIFALYDFKKGRLVPTNLKEEFKIITPEIQLIDIDNDGINEFKFMRLWHNGTFNAIETQIIKVEKDKVIILETKQKPIGKYT